MEWGWRRIQATQLICRNSVQSIVLGPFQLYLKVGLVNYSNLGLSSDCLAVK